MLTKLSIIFRFIIHPKAMYSWIKTESKISVKEMLILLFCLAFLCPIAALVAHDFNHYEWQFYNPSLALKTYIYTILLALIIAYITNTLVFYFKGIMDFRFALLNIMIPLTISSVSNSFFIIIDTVLLTNKIDAEWAYTLINISSHYVIPAYILCLFLYGFFRLMECTAVKSVVCGLLTIALSGISIVLLIFTLKYLNIL